MAREVRPPAPPRRLPKAISVEEVAALLDGASVGDGVLAIRDRALLEVLYGTGARISEAVGLTVTTSTWSPRTVSLTGKGGKQRRVPLGSYAARAVDDYLVRARPALADAAEAAVDRGCSSTPGAVRCRGRAPGRCSGRPPSGRGCAPTSRRTRCGTRSPRT